MLHDQRERRNTWLGVCQRLRGAGRWQALVRDWARSLGVCIWLWVGAFCWASIRLGGRAVSLVAPTVQLFKLAYCKFTRRTFNLVKYMWTNHNATTIAFAHELLLSDFPAEPCHQTETHVQYSFSLLESALTIAKPCITRAHADITMRSCTCHPTPQVYIRLGTVIATYV